MLERYRREVRRRCLGPMLQQELNAEKYPVDIRLSETPPGSSGVRRQRSSAMFPCLG